MVGEFEYDNTFVDSINSTSERTGNPLNPFPEISLFFMNVFLFMMSIILMNLLVSASIRVIIGAPIRAPQRTL